MQSANIEAPGRSQWRRPVAHRLVSVTSGLRWPPKLAAFVTAQLVGNPGSMLRSDFTKFGVQLGQDSDDLRPRRQPYPRGISRASLGS